jgi:integrase
LSQAKRLWRYAEVRDWVKSPCIEGLRRQHFDARPRRRTVTLDWSELAQLWNVLSNAQKCKADKVTIAALRLLILTGQREREVTEATWNEFDLEASVWKIPAARTKAHRAHVVHLAPQAVDVLQRICAPEKRRASFLLRPRAEDRRSTDGA